MKKQIGKSVLVIAAVFATVTARAVEVEIDTAALEAGGIRVSGLVLDITSTVSCDNPQYNEFDTNQDGVLDKECYGLRYNPCSGEGPDYHAYYLAGGTCGEKPVVCIPDGNLTTGAPAC